MKPQEIRTKNPEELKRLLQNKRAELCQARFDIKSNQTRDHQKQARTKKDIARILTVLKESK